MPGPPGGPRSRIQARAAPKHSGGSHPCVPRLGQSRAPCCSSTGCLHSASEVKGKGLKGQAALQTEEPRGAGAQGPRAGPAPPAADPRARQEEPPGPRVGGRQGWQLGGSGWGESPGTGCTGTAQAPSPVLRERRQEAVCFPAQGAKLISGQRPKGGSSDRREGDGAWAESTQLPPHSTLPAGWGLEETGFGGPGDEGGVRSLPLPQPVAPAARLLALPTRGCKSRGSAVHRDPQVFSQVRKLSLRHHLLRQQLSGDAYPV